MSIIGSSIITPIVGSNLYTIVGNLTSIVEEEEVIEPHAGNCFTVSTTDEDTCFTISTSEPECFWIKGNDDSEAPLFPSQPTVDFSSLGISKIFSIRSAGSGTLFMVCAYDYGIGAKICLVECNYYTSLDDGIYSPRSVYTYTNIEDKVLNENSLGALKGYGDQYTSDLAVVYSDSVFIYSSVTLEYKRTVALPSSGNWYGFADSSDFIVGEVLSGSVLSCSTYSSEETKLIVDSGGTLTTTDITSGCYSTTPAYNYITREMDNYDTIFAYDDDLISVCVGGTYFPHNFDGLCVNTPRIDGKVWEINRGVNANANTFLSNNTYIGFFYRNGKRFVFMNKDDMPSGITNSFGIEITPDGDNIDPTDGTLVSGYCISCNGTSTIQQQSIE